MTPEQIESQIVAIQKSTNTVLPGFTGMHNALRMGSKMYYTWHTKSFASTVHWAILIISIVIILMIFRLFFV